MANQIHDLRDRLDAFLGPAVDHSSRTGTDDMRLVSGDRLRWPVEAADLIVLDAGRPVAVCTLGDPSLARSLAACAPPIVGVIAPLATENIGIEKLVRNVVANPDIRLLVVAGPETGGCAPTGHYAGDAVFSLAREGVDPATMRIRGARGRRPYVKNLTLDEVELFRDGVTLVDLRGCADLAEILAAAEEGAARLAIEHSAAARPVPSACEPPPCGSAPTPSALAGPTGPGLTRRRQEPTVDDRHVYRPDPAGYVLIFVEHTTGDLILEHYTNAGDRTTVLAGRDPMDMARAVVDRGLVSTLDHAAYVGCELARAAEAGKAGSAFIQDEPDFSEEAPITGGVEPARRTRPH